MTSPQSLVVLLLILFFLLMVLQVLYWNCGGAGTHRCNSIPNDIIKMHNLDLLFIAEPKVSGSKAEEALRRINIQCLKRIEVKGRSRGVWVFIQNNTFTFEIIKMGFNFIHLSIKGGKVPEMVCIAVYIYPQSTRKRQCFDNIKELAKGVTKPWIIIGDFNEIISEEEKKGGAPIDHNRCFHFRRWLNDYGLMNLETVGPRYT